MTPHRLVAVALALLVALLPVETIGAQERPSLFRFLFGGPRRAAPPPEVRRAVPMVRRVSPPRAAAAPRVARKRAVTRKPARTPRTTGGERRSPRKSGRGKAAAAAAAGASAASIAAGASAASAASTAQADVAPDEGPVEKADTARRVLVIGDFYARALAEGLEDTYADEADLVVIDKSNGASGLVRPDVVDWSAELPKLVAGERADAIVVMIGANDRQSIRDAAGAMIREGTPEWEAAYKQRAEVLAGAIQATGKPSFWVGLVPVRAVQTAKGYSAQNDLVRDALRDSAIPFVQVWDAFADPEGRYIASGPDVNGQTQLLRVGDGLGFTEAGERKLAFFLERDLDRLVATAAPALSSLGLGASPDPAALPDPAAASVPSAPRVGPAVALDVFGGGGALATLAPTDLGPSAPPAPPAVATVLPAAPAPVPPSPAAMPETPLPNAGAPAAIGTPAPAPIDDVSPPVPAPGAASPVTTASAPVASKLASPVPAPVETGRVPGAPVGRADNFAWPQSRD